MGPDIEAALADIEAIIRADGAEEMTLPERAGMFAALKHLCGKLRQTLAEDGCLSTYAAEKLSKVGHHGAGIFGFEETGRMDRAAQRQFAYADLHVLRSEIERQIGGAE